MQVNHLLSTWLSGSETESSRIVREKLEEKIDSYAAGELDHAVDIISSIWEISRKGDVITEAPDRSPVSSPPSRSPSPWLGPFKKEFWGWDIRSSLARSITDGYFLDRKYWARRSRGGAMEPIYISYSAIQAELGCFDACESLYLKIFKVLTSAVLACHSGDDDNLNWSDEDEYAEDSDYEDEPEAVSKPVRENTYPGQDQGQGPYPVFRIGSSVA